MKPTKCLSYVLCLGIVFVTSAEGLGTKPNSVERQPELQRVSEPFLAWAAGHSAKAKAATTRAIEDGLMLARERKQALAELIRRDPAAALAQAVPESVRQNLPTEILDELETPVSGVGDLFVACAMPAQGTDDGLAIIRLARVNGRSYQAYVYGRRSAQTTKYNIPIHGIAIADVLAVQESVLAELDPIETAAVTNGIIDVPPLLGVKNSEPKLARIGDVVYRFACKEELERGEARLESAESGFAAKAVASAKDLLAAGAGATQSDNPARPLVAPSQPEQKKVLVIRTDFSDMPGDPRWMGSSQPLSAEAVQKVAETEVSTYYHNSSYGHVELAFTVTPQLYRLPQTAANYATVFLFLNLYSDALAAARNDYSIGAYDMVVVLFSWLGSLPNSRIQFGGINLLGTGTVCVNGEFDFRVVAHELGHTFGLYHANFWETNDGNPISDNGTSIEYGDVFDTMGANWGNDHRTDFNPWFKSRLSWISGNQVQTVTSNGLYRVYRFDSASATGTMALKIAKDSGRSYWIGCRRNFTENATMQHGAYVIWGYDWSTQSNLLGLGDIPNMRRDAALAVGATLVDPEANLSITPVAEGGEPPSEYLDVQVSFGAPPLILAQPEDQHVLAGHEARFAIAVDGNSAHGSLFWQRQIHGTTQWTALTDDASFEGCTSPTLLVRTSVAMTGDAFRCSITGANGVRNVSHEALLTVDQMAPRLEMSLVSGQLLLSWPASSTGFVLERRGGLAGDAVWNVVTNPAALVGDRFVVTNRPELSAEFFRLHRQ